MADAPIGVTFIPNAENQQLGPKQAAIEGGPGASDLSQAFKVLSLHLPQVLGAGALSPRRLLQSPGSAGISTAGLSASDAPGGGTSPNAAAFMALIQAMLGNGFNFGSMGGSPSSAGASASSPGGGYAPAGGPAPKIEYGNGPKAPDIFGGGQEPAPPAPSMPSAPADAPSSSWAGDYSDNSNNDRQDRYI